MTKELFSIHIKKESCKCCNSLAKSTIFFFFSNSVHSCGYISEKEIRLEAGGANLWLGVSDIVKSGKEFWAKMGEFGESTLASQCISLLSTFTSITVVQEKSLFSSAVLLRPNLAFIANLREWARERRTKMQVCTTNVGILVASAYLLKEMLQVWTFC